jgi:acetate kinase
VATRARQILVLNTGSSSLKWVALDAQSEQVVDRGEASWRDPAPDRHADELADTLRRVPEVDAVSHRVVHGGARFREPVLIDDAVRQAIVDLAPLAPLHNPAAIDGIDAARKQFPTLPQVATFDTAYHATIPDMAATYAVPWDWNERWGLRRFGFHGLSVEYAVSRTRELLGRAPERMVVCHLGAGCSITAVRDGRSIDTSMGFTPLEGVMMARRSGSVDPGLLLHVLRSLDVSTVDKALNEESGLLGISGVSTDMREVLAAAASENQRAALARDMFVYRVVTCVGSMAAALGGMDALVFTGGIGERSAEIRQRVCSALEFLGVVVHLSDAAEDRDIAAPQSRVRVLVIAAREDLTVLRQTRQLLDVS